MSLQIILYPLSLFITVIDVIGGESWHIS